MAERCATCGQVVVLSPSGAICPTCDVRGALSGPSPCEVDLGRAMNALRDAIADARSDARRARAAGDELGATTDDERAEGLQRVCDWLEAVELRA